jgi:choline dehydrogenase
MGKNSCCCLKGDIQKAVKAAEAATAAANRTARLVAECCDTCVQVKDSYDFVVVGAGSAGSFVAERLSRGGTNSVLILDIGRNNQEDPAFTTEANLANFTNFQNSGTTISNKTVALNQDPAGGSQVIPLVGGLGWGGASGINLLQAVRPSPEFFGRLEALAGVDWSYTQAIPLLKAIENYSGGASTYRGDSGPINIYQPADPPPSPFLTNMATGLVNTAFPPDAGLAIVPDYNSNSDINVAYASQTFTKAEGGTFIRSFAGNDILLKDIVDQSGKGINGRDVLLVSNAKVQRVLLNSAKRATCVEYTLEGKTTRKVRANKQIILSAGTLSTPGILELSGIGDPAVLGNLGIDTLVNLPDVGNNIHNHPGLLSFIEVPTAEVGGLINNNAYFGPSALVRLNTGATNRNLQIACLPSGVDFYSTAFCINSLVQENIPPPFAGANSPVMCIGFMLNPQGSGSIHIADKGGAVAPGFTYSTFTDPLNPVSQDGTTIANYYNYVRDAAADAGYDMYYPTPADYAQGDDRLRQIGQSLNFPSQHWTGSCKMSTGSDGVVDAKLKVKGGVSGLTIADNSIWPIIPDCNTCIPAYYVGKIAGEFLAVEFSIPA